MEQDRTKINISFVARIIMVLFIALIVGLSVFTFFRIRTGAKEALREAKNIRMSLRGADIEMYAAGKSIYNPNNVSGLEDGAKEKAEQIFTPKGYYRLTSYDSKKHELTGLEYTVGRYQVYYKKKGDNNNWDVDYVLNVYSYDESDDIVNSD